MTFTQSTTMGTNSVSLPIYSNDSLLRYSGPKATVLKTPCIYSSSISSPPVLTRGTMSAKCKSSLGDRSIRETVSRKRNLSEFSDGSKSLRDETVKEKESMLRSPRPLVNNNYPLDGGIQLSSPGITRFDDSNEYGGISYRRRLDDLSTPRSQNELFDSTEDLDSTFDESDKKYGVIDGQSSWEKGWSQVALQAMNVVAGKAWEFCKNSAAIFRGFQAGGGTRYKLKYDADSNMYFEAVENFLSEKEKFGDLEPTSLFTEYPQIYQSLSNNSDDVRSDYSSQRPSKRYQLSSNDNDSLERNWVVVPTVTSTPRKNSSEPAASRKLPSTRLPKFSPAHIRSTCHYAACRSTPRPSNSRRFIPRLSRPQISHAGSPSLSSTQRASFTSPRSPGGHIPRPTTSNSKTLRNDTQDKFLESPTALESKRQAQHWAVLLKKGEKRQDESIQRLDERLKEMIREGKEALGSKVEVSMEDYDDHEVM